MTGNSLHNVHSSDQIDRLVQKTQRNPQRAQTTADVRASHKPVARDVPTLPL